jgi:hypothetical protein
MHNNSSDHAQARNDAKSASAPHKEVLKQLEGLKAPEDANAREALEFSRSLMAYRLRLDRHLIQAPCSRRMVKLSEGISLETAKAEAETRASGE